MTNKYLWTEEYSVDVAEIDEQHKEFFKIVNSLLEAADDNAISRENLLMKLGELGDYVVYHLATEEELFAKYNYPAAASHIEVHNQFRSKAKEMFNNARAVDVDYKKIAGEAADFAGNWLQSHILIMDKQYTKFFNEQGLQ